MSPIPIEWDSNRGGELSCSLCGATVPATKQAQHQAFHDGLEAEKEARKAQESSVQAGGTW